MMIKYGTYRVFRSKDTSNIKRLLMGESDELEKTASDANWEELDYDPEEDADELDIQPV